ncbi:MAG: LytTR family DNA-binding domain-containing protein [Bacteroidia bacterium]|jgi:DNA-binding LytR/AlgR family response regulator|nr:LytTR family DNA-binding domain-containing protein [Bacteroidia bacterium]
MKWRCLLADDEDLALKLLGHFMAQEDTVQIVGAFSSADEALRHIEQEKPELLFLDIQMPERSGLDLIAALSYRPVVVLVTAYSEHAGKAFDLDVADYLLKPYSQERFKRSLQKATELAEVRFGKQLTEKPLLLRRKGLTEKVNPSDMLFVEGLKQYVKIVTPEHTYVHHITLKELETQLPDFFIRVHKSYIINRSKTDSFKQGKLSIGNYTIPVGRSYKGNLE